MRETGNEMRGKMRHNERMLTIQDEMRMAWVGTRIRGRDVTRINWP